MMTWSENLRINFGSGGRRAAGRCTGAVAIVIIEFFVMSGCADDKGDAVSGLLGSAGTFGFAGIPAAGTGVAGVGAAGTGAAGSGALAGTGAAGVSGLPTAGTAAAGTDGSPVAGSGAAGSVGEAGTGAAGSGSTSVDCTGKTLAAGDSTEMLQHDGQNRRYLLHVPAKYDGGKAVPLVLDIHGLTSSDTAQKGLSGWQKKSDEEGFILVHPDGLGNSWNGGDLCCGSSQSSGVDDEGFMRAIVQKVSERACIDPKRVYASGLSNGGAMSHLLACNASDVFAATAPVSMGNGTRPCDPSRPISVIMFRGTADTLVSYNGGLFPSAKADFDQWKMLNGCTGTPTKTHSICETYTGCEGGTEVTLCTIQGGSHVVYGQSASAGAPVPDVAWEAFLRQTLP
jgi:polyhydroxybutyrate depolymerase